MYEEFLKPTLLIALFAPPEELSAGVVLGAFYFYTLAHQSDFDVCWCKVLQTTIALQTRTHCCGASGKPTQHGLSACSTWSWCVIGMSSSACFIAL